MENHYKASVVYSEALEEINSPDFKDWGVHLLCLEGEGSFTFNGKRVCFKKNDALVISHPELVRDISMSSTLKVRFIAAPFKFLYNLLPANHYGVGGCISLFDNPVIPLSDRDADIFNNDLEQIRSRIDDREHLFYDELIGSLALTMIYDLFDFHAKIHEGTSTTERTANVVKSLLALLEGGRTKQHREVSYYAEKLNVTPRYLSDTVKRTTGRSVTYLIDRHTVPIVVDYLNNSDLSLTQIADEMNFASLSYFSRYVQKHLGMSPKEYRMSHSPLKGKF